MRILIYAFKPYGPYTENVSDRVLGGITAGRGVSKQVFEVTFDARMFLDACRGHRPDIIIGLGQHPRARKIRIERRSHNWMKADNRQGRLIGRGLPDFRYSTLSLPRRPGTTLAYDAGSYVCNFSMYIIAGYAQAQRVRSGFLHLPMTMDIDGMVTYVEGVVRTAGRANPG